MLTAFFYIKKKNTCGGCFDCTFLSRVIPNSCMFKNSHTRNMTYACILLYVVTFLHTYNIKQHVVYHVYLLYDHSYVRLEKWSTVYTSYDIMSYKNNDIIFYILRKLCIVVHHIKRELLFTVHDHIHVNRQNTRNIPTLPT